jgi:hypothetical protein
MLGSISRQQQLTSYNIAFTQGARGLREDLAEQKNMGARHTPTRGAAALRSVVKASRYTTCERELP